MKILIYSYNDKIGDGLQKVSFLQQIRITYPNAFITYSTTNTTTLKKFLNPLIQNCIDEFIENNEIQSSFKNIFISNKVFKNHFYDLIIDLQKVVLRTLSLKKIPHNSFFSASANFIFSDYKNINNLKFKNIYIENFYFNILNILKNKNYKVADISIPSFKINISTINKNKTKVAISPGASSNDRKWQFEKYLTIANFLKSKDFEVYFFLGPDEFEYIDICRNHGFICPEWTDKKEKISNNILYTMNLAKEMDYCLSNDSGTSWFFQFANVKTLKIFGNTNSIKFSRPDYCSSIQTSNYGFNDIKDFPIELYKEKLMSFLK
jgi:ADP-heptose:LPS heptosyltransferase